MKQNLLIKVGFVGVSLLMATSCSSDKKEISSLKTSKEESSESVYVDPNTVTFPSAYTLEQKLNSQFAVRLEYVSEDISGEINFVRYNNYTKYTDSNKEKGLNFFVKGTSGEGLYYEADDNGRYSSFTFGDFDQFQCYKNACIGCFAGETYTFASNTEISYLGRECVKYTNTVDLDESLIMDKETGLILHYGLSGIKNQAFQTSNFKFDVKEISFGESAKSKISQDINNICATPLDAAMLEGLGFHGELETPHFSISDCSTKWQGNSLSEYSIEYKERVSSGNDTYINQFETFTTCLYNMGFKKDSAIATGVKNYEELVVDSTVDYDADITFLAYASTGTTTYKAESNVTVKGGQASIKFNLALA